MSESEADNDNAGKQLIKNVRKMEKDDINNIVGLRKSTKLSNMRKSRTYKQTGASMGGQSSY
jgi:hypothetical protein